MDIELSPGQFGLGLEPTPSGTTGLPAYTGAVIPRSEWASTYAMKRFVPRGKTQFNLPACTSYTNGKMFQTAIAVAVGRAGWWPEVSYCAAHQEITRNNMQQGSRAVDCIRLMVDRGLVPVMDGVPEFYGTPRQLPAAAQQERLKYAGGEWEEVFSVEQAVSAILSNHPVNIPVDWREADTNPGPTGHLKLNAGRLLGGHSILGCGIVLNYPESPSGLGFLCGNHHGDKLTPNTKNEFGQVMKAGSWGDDGFCVVPAERVAVAIPKYSSCALRTVKVLDEWILA